MFNLRCIDPEKLDDGSLIDCKFCHTCMLRENEYAVKVSIVKNDGPGRDASIVEIYQQEWDFVPPIEHPDHELVVVKSEKIGGYSRNDPHDAEWTFAPFKLNGKEYALFSDWSCGLSVMELPSCEVISKSSADGIGRVKKLWVPSDYDFLSGKQRFSPIAIVTGGDDWGKRLFAVDLQKAVDGEIVLDRRFGETKAPFDKHPAEFIDFYFHGDSDKYTVEIPVMMRFYSDEDFKRKSMPFQAKDVMFKNPNIRYYDREGNEIHD